MAALYDNFPLNAEQREIRLLILHPAGWCEPIYCDFEIVSLKHSPIYSALSYVWGKENAVHDISLGGQFVKIRPNLLTALRKLRAHARSQNVVVWVDALCINQASIAERNSQVAMMGDIYSRSERVQVWLGELEFAPEIWPESTVATQPDRCYNIPEFLDSLQLPPGDWKRTEEYGTALDGLPESEAFLRTAVFLQLMADRNDFITQSRYLFWDPTNSPRLERHLKHVLRAIEENAWFERLWVVQEVVLAPMVSILIGPVALPLDTFAQAKSQHNGHKQWPYYGGFGHKSSELLLETGISPFVEVARVRQQIRDRAVTLTITELRLQLSRRAATVDHDQIYSLFGVSDYLAGLMTGQSVETGTLNRQPLYDDPPARLYQAITEEHITQKLDLLPFSISSHKNSHPETRSWTIDWTILQGTSLEFDQLMWTRIYPLFDADHGLNAAPPLLQGRGGTSAVMLQLQGHFIDRIATFTSFASLFNGDNTFIHTLRKHDPQAQYPGAEQTTWSDAWIRCITADSVTTNEMYCEGRELSQPRRLRDDPDEEGFKSRGRYVLATHDPWIVNAAERNCDRFEERRSIWGRYRYYGNIPPHSPEVNRLREFRDGLNAQVEGITRGRMVFLTERGYLGITNNCNVSDEVYVVGGGKMPIILEKHPGMSPEEDLYRVASDCYLHGFMDGEHNACFNRSNDALRTLRVM